MGCALWSQGTNHGSVGIGEEVVVVEGGVPPLVLVLVDVEVVVGVRGGPPLELVLVGVEVVVGVGGGPPLELVLVGVEVVVGVGGGPPLELVLVGVKPDVGVREPIATARPGRAWGTSLVRGVSVGGWLVTDVTRGVNKPGVLVVGGAVLAGRLDKGVTDVTRGVDKSEVFVVTRGVNKPRVLVVWGAVLAGWLDKGVTDVTRGANKSEVLVVGGASAAGQLLVGFSMRARKMVSSAGVRALESNPVERLSLWLTGEVPCWGVYWAGCRIALTISARNCSSPVGNAGRPFCSTAAASA